MEDREPACEAGLATPALVRFSALAVQALADARAEIDALNVYPVPDGDTGTNLFLTLQSGDEALSAHLNDRCGTDAAGPRGVVGAYIRGVLLGARGNSGVIMAQLLGALLRHLVGAPAADPPAAVLAAAMAEASRAGYAAVGQPVEGTVLTVSRAAAEAALATAHAAQASVEEVLGSAVRAARQALDRTPEQLAVLRDAGVVDAGGAGLCLVLEAAQAAYTGRRLPGPGERLARRPLPVPLPTGDLTPEGPAYEVMYLLDADDDAVPGLRENLSRLGSSVVVVGGEGLWNVHVHSDDVGSAVEAGIEAGRPYRIRVTHFAEQLAGRDRPADSGRQPGRQPGRAVVVVAFGAGLARIFRDAGGHVVEVTARRRPSTGELLEAVRATRAAEVVLVPNDRDIVATAESAARLAESEDGIRVAVIPTHTQVQGIAALAVSDPGRPFEQDLVEMAVAARHTRSGAVTVAGRRAMTSAGPCEPGDVLGAVEGDYAVVGGDLFEVAVEVITRLLGGGGELFTVVAGADGQELAERCAQFLRQAFPAVDVFVYDGGQDRYPVLFGVE